MDDYEQKVAEGEIKLICVGDRMVRVQKLQGETYIGISSGQDLARIVSTTREALGDALKKMEHNRLPGFYRP